MKYLRRIKLAYVSYRTIRFHFRGVLTRRECIACLIEAGMHRIDKPQEWECMADGTSGVI